MTPVTLQKAGRLATGLPPGGVELPAGTDTALAMDAPGSVRWASASQGVAADAGAATARQAKRAKTARTIECSPVRLIILCSHRTLAYGIGGTTLDINMSRYAPALGSPSLGAHWAKSLSLAARYGPGFTSKQTTCAVNTAMVCQTPG